MPSKYERKRKRELDKDTTKSTGAEEKSDEDQKRRHRSSRSRSPNKRSSKKSRRQHDDDGGGGDKNEESLSVAETNKLRAKLGLAPLELEDSANTEPVEKDDGSGEKVFTEDGVEIVHKPSQNWSESKRQRELKEKLDTKRKQRDVYGKVLKAKKGLAEDSDDEEGTADTVKWVERNRKIEEEMRRAQARAKQLDEMDEAFGIGGMIQAEQQKQRQKHGHQKQNDKAMTGGLVIGHSVQDFSEGRETVLVLQDKSILEDDEDEVLINPNMIENDRHKLHMERRKKKATHYQAYEDGEEIDEFGQVKQREILAKYDDGLDGEAKKCETFRLDETGQYDLDKEAQEAEAKRRLMMMNKKFESLGATKYTLANEFYTEEEIIQFRRPKKGKGTKNMRKKKALKADDLEPIEETDEQRRVREAKLAARREGLEDKKEAKFRETMKAAKEEAEDGELMDETTSTDKEAKSKEDVTTTESIPAIESNEKFKAPKANVNLSMLQSLAAKMKKGEEEESDEEEEDDLPHSTNVAPIRIDDEAEYELNDILAKARRLKQTEQMTKNGSKFSRKIMAFKGEDEESSDEEEKTFIGKSAIVFDATSEKYKAIGGGGGYGGGTRKEIKKEEPHEMEEEEEEEEMDAEKFMEIMNEETKKKKKQRRRRTESDSSNDFERMEEDRDGSERPNSSQSGMSNDDMSTSQYTNILGEERDVTKGVGAMLKLAGEKGYLEVDNRRRVGEGTLKHLESKRYSKVEQGRLDIEDKTMRKLERMGTTGTGPTRPFPEKPDYKPKIEINYSDKSGRALEPKEAFRMLSWKFHGKGPGKKQAEKHTMKVMKREKMKKMNSQDTPLGTLNKQLKKQEQLQAPYLVLSGRGDAAPLQKE